MGVVVIAVLSACFKVPYTGSDCIFRVIPAGILRKPFFKVSLLILLLLIFFLARTFERFLTVFPSPDDVF